MPTAKKPKTRAKASSDAAAAAQETEPKGSAGADQVAQVAAQGVATPDSGELLQLMWAAQVRALLAILNTTDPVAIPAATLATIQRFLADNNVNAETVERRRKELELLQKQAGDFHNLPFGSGDGSEDFRRQRDAAAPFDPEDPDGAKEFARSQAGRG